MWVKKAKNEDKVLTSLKNEFAQTMTEVGSAIIVTMRPDMTTEEFNALSEALLERVEQHHALAVVLDFSAVDLLDKTDLQRVLAMLRASKMLGASSAICSLARSIVCFMVDQDANLKGIQFFHGLHDALKVFGKRKKK